MLLAKLVAIKLRSLPVIMYTEQCACSCTIVENASAEPEIDARKQKTVAQRRTDIVNNFVASRMKVEMN